MAIQPFSYIPNRSSVPTSSATPKASKKGGATQLRTAAIDDSDAYTDPRENRSNRGEGKKAPNWNQQTLQDQENANLDNPAYREGRVGGYKGPTATSNWNQQTLQDQENANLDNPAYREGRVGGYKGPEATPPMYGNRSGAYTSDGTEGSMRKNFAEANPDPMYGPPAPAFPEREEPEYLSHSEAMLQDPNLSHNERLLRNPEGISHSEQMLDNEAYDRNIGRQEEYNDPSEITANAEQRASAAANGGNSNAPAQAPQRNQSFGRDALGGSFNNPDTQRGFNQAMRPQAPAQAAQGGQEDLVANWAKYHGKGAKNAYNPKSSADRAMLAAMQEAQRTGQSVSRVANGALSTEGRRAAGKLIPYSKNPNSIYAKGR